MAKKKGKVDQFNIDEVFRQLRTNIEFSQMDEGIHVVNVVSTHPNEGKSTVASNLARIFAAKYNKVLLVDCDLRNPSVHKMLKVSNSGGLSNLLSEFVSGTSILDYSEVKSVRYKDTQEALYFLSSGSRVPNPAELLASMRFSKFIMQAREEFDYVILDCPPTNAVSDATPVCNAADGTLYVVSSRDTDKYEARTAINELTRNGANIIGCVLTKVDDFASKHYGYYGEYGQKR